MKVRYPSRVRYAYHCKPLKVRTAYPTIWLRFGFIVGGENKFTGLLGV